MLASAPRSAAQPGRYANRHGKGAARRRFVAEARGPDRVWGAMEDEMHHFELELSHDGEKVVDVHGWAVRWPWGPCFDSPTALAALIGCPLSQQASMVGGFTVAREQCTHQFDLAVFVIAHAHRLTLGGAARREYLTVVPDWLLPPFGAYLWRDRLPLLSWLTDGATVLGPDPFRGVPLRSRFIEWCEASLDADLAEAAQMLRRGVWISPARRIDLEACDEATESSITPGVCYTTQPHRLTIAPRSRNSLRDYSNTLF